MLMIGSKEIGGGFVRRAFTDGETLMAVGAPLSAEKINAWPNRRTLIESGLIAVYPPHGEGAATTGPAERHMVHLGRGQYDVIAGTKLNDRPLSKDEAEDLATQPD
jgi:hypothetical protein